MDQADLDGMGHDPIEQGIVPARSESPDPSESSQRVPSVYSEEPPYTARGISPGYPGEEPRVHSDDDGGGGYPMERGYSPNVPDDDYPHDQLQGPPESPPESPAPLSEPTLEMETDFPVHESAMPLDESPCNRPDTLSPMEPAIPPRKRTPEKQPATPEDNHFNPSIQQQPSYPQRRLSPANQPPSQPPPGPPPTTPNKTPERHPSFQHPNSKPHTPTEPGYRSFPRRHHGNNHSPMPFPVATPDGSSSHQRVPSPSGPVGTHPARSLSTLAGHEDDRMSRRTDRTTLDKDAQLKARKLYRSAVTHLLCGLYAVILIVIGIVFAISSSLTTKTQTLEDSIYLQIFLLYIFTASLLFLCYLHCCLFRFRAPRNTGSLRVNHASNNQIDQGDKTFNDYTPHEADMTSTLSKEKRSRSHSQSEFEDVMTNLSQAVNGPAKHPVSFDAEGINFYLRLGALAFGTGSMIHDGFRIASLFIDGEFSLTCRGPIYVAVAGAHMIFVFFQTFYIFKSHKIIINKHKAFVRLGFMHMVATNICCWCITTVTETAQDLHSPHLQEAPQAEPSPATVGNSTESGNGTGLTSTDCISAYLSSLAFTASPYLYPCTIEYSLIAAAVLYRMYTNVGSVVGRHSVGALEDITLIRMDCHKANKGLFTGILVAVLTLIAVSCFFVFEQRIFGYDAGSLIFFGTEIILLVLALAVVIVGFGRIQKLRYSHDSKSNRLDLLLIIVGFLGICFLNIFILVSSISHLLPFDLMSLLSLTTASLALVQSFFQTIFIMDALRRSARSENQVLSKPGRAIVTFLLLCNLSLWVVNTFEVQKAESITIHTSFYGYLPWAIISHMCIPLIIFFRFHSTVCLSDIWVNAYKLKKKEN